VKANTFLKRQDPPKFFGDCLDFMEFKRKWSSQVTSHKSPAEYKRRTGDDGNDTSTGDFNEKQKEKYQDLKQKAGNCKLCKVMHTLQSRSAGSLAMDKLRKAICRKKNTNLVDLNVAIRAILRA